MSISSTESRSVQHQISRRFKSCHYLTPTCRHFQTLRWVEALPIDLLFRTRIVLLPASDILKIHEHIIHGVQIGLTPDILEIQELSSPNTNLSSFSNFLIGPAPDILKIQELSLLNTQTCRHLQTLRWVEALTIDFLFRTRIDLLPALDILEIQEHIVHGVLIGPAPNIQEIQELSLPNTNLSPSSDSSVGGGASNRPSTSNSNQPSSCTRYPGVSRAYHPRSADRSPPNSNLSSSSDSSVGGGASNRPSSSSFEDKAVGGFWWIYDEQKTTL
ncbi:hypothetical protein TIFTF001_045202 [Ficus carica]|uniref:Uncharacterized protein n=1 Tax=Ficus carica TaxID=3494 RepID=A0AA88CH87_FICCA|nr:hypothetical protein TIFTF001_045202 [Ficus carica]